MATQLIFGQVSCHEYGFDALMALTFLPITAGTILLFLLTGQRFKNPPLRDHALDQVELGISQDAMDFSCIPSSLRLFDTELVVDAKSLYTALSAVAVREPSEKSCGVLLFC